MTCCISMKFRPRDHTATSAAANSLDSPAYRPLLMCKLVVGLFVSLVVVISSVFGGARIANLPWFVPHMSSQSVGVASLFASTIHVP